MKEFFPASDLSAVQGWHMLEICMHSQDSSDDPVFTDFAIEWSTVMYIESFCNVYALRN